MLEEEFPLKRRLKIVPSQCQSLAHMRKESLGVNRPKYSSPRNPSRLPPRFHHSTSDDEDGDTDDDDDDTDDDDDVEDNGNHHELTTTETMTKFHLT